ncbi:GNAT family N-acetyltransferase [Streptomyces sp. NBC_01381]|uniref:GNAT family N-acetyltransferase n=1 Tax=Streptomyces sp. NBC_01381 TaxID=2903845 RepID=UPI00225AA9FB|nr:GNAT family N-acetyltransferase [Streptomyces sp. NBC_01381]MCX4666430.1 GNAT family N-acetyltransferase [Streptomyces sp. NBC_01381]
MIRPYRPTDAHALRARINADRPPGQPACTAQTLDEALRGNSTRDTACWQELDAPRTDVLVDHRDSVTGAVSYAIRRRDDAVVVLWMHCREEATASGLLIDHVLEQARLRTVHAFEFASAFSSLEGLPAQHRATTRRVLTAAGFTQRDLWRYLRAELPITGLKRLANYSTSPTKDQAGRHLMVQDAGTLIAEATISNPVDGIGVLRWLHVEPEARRQGLGTAVLASALDLLAGLGAREVVAFVDDDAPGDPERDRSAANALYDAVGFTEVDRLLSFTRRP